LTLQIPKANVSLNKPFGAYAGDTVNITGSLDYGFNGTGELEIWTANNTQHVNNTFDVVDGQFSSEFDSDGISSGEKRAIIYVYNQTLYVDGLNYTNITLNELVECGDSSCTCGDRAVNYTSLDESFSCTDVGLMIEDDNVTLDCTGYPISISDTENNTIGIYLTDFTDKNYTTNITIQNCNISGFKYGIYSQDEVSANITIINSTLAGNNISFSMVNISYLSIINSTIKNTNQTFNVTNITHFYIYNSVIINSSTLITADYDFNATYLNNTLCYNSNPLINTSAVTYANNTFCINSLFPANNTWTTNSSILLEFNITDFIPSLDVNCSINLNGTSRNSTTAISHGGSHVVNTSTIADSNYTLQVNCTDSQGNKGLSPKVIVNRDTTAPNVSVSLGASVVTQDNVAILLCTATDALDPTPTYNFTVTKPDNTNSSVSGNSFTGTDTIGTYTAYCYGYDRLLNYNKSSTNFEVTSAISLPQGTSGQGGGGGGSSSAYDPKVYNFATVESLSPGNPGVVKFVDTLAINQITLAVNKDVRGVTFTINSYDLLPEESAKISGFNTYKYFDIQTKNLEENDIDSATIRFKVDPSWIKQNQLSTKEIILQRFTNGFWSALPTTFVERDAEYYYFDAITQGFSYFAITANKKQDLITEETTNETEPSIEKVIEFVKPRIRISYKILILYLVIFILVAGIIVYLGRIEITKLIKKN